MSPRVLIVPALLALAAIPSCGEKPGSTPAPATSSTPATANAADTYRTIGAELGQPLLDAAREGNVSDDLLTQHAAQIDRIIEASRAETCDFHIDWSQGLNTLLPHLADLRAIARVIKADARRALAAGDLDAAAKRVAAIFRLSSHIVQNGRSVIELLVADAIAELGAEFVKTNPQLASAAWKTDIQQAIAKLREGGTLHSGRIVRDECKSIIDSLRDGKVPDASSFGGRNWAAVSQSEREEAASKLEPILNDLVAAWDGPDAAPQLAAIMQRGHSAGVSDLIPALDKARTAVDKLKVSIAAAEKVLAK